MARDNWALDRFVSAQGPIYERVCAELKRGRKESHWMWFIFPQLAGLGSSPTARHYAISGLDEARAYLGHPLLGARLLECTRLVNAISGVPIAEIFGFPDDKKFHSCMTLFASCGNDEDTFTRALQKYFSGTPDAQTLSLLGITG